jgi:acid phosphatase type 7
MLYKEGADVILSGHAHYYERFRPQRPDGTRDPTYGIREFIAGTGDSRPTTRCVYRERPTA